MPYTGDQLIFMLIIMGAMLVLIIAEQLIKLFRKLFPKKKSLDKKD